MSLLGSAIAIQRSKRAKRIDSLASEKPTVAILAEPSGFDRSTGVLIATAPDGGEIQYSAGNFRAQPSVISVVPAKNSVIAFGDWL